MTTTGWLLSRCHDYEKPVDRQRLKDLLRPWRKPKTRFEPKYTISLKEQVAA